MSKQGWIKIYRKITDCVIWNDGSIYDKRSAWIDMLLMASHKDTNVMFDGNLVPVQTGSFITSKRRLSERWQWSITKVSKFLNVLENDGMLIVKSNSKKTLVTVVNYSVYQGSEFEKSNTEITQKEHSSNTEITQKKTINNIKNIKNEKNNIYSREIIDYLNLKSGKRFRYTDTNIRFVSARLNEGFTLEDFKKVIDFKVNEWANDKMEQYLRPQTLFGTKFESYLNAVSSVHQNNIGNQNQKQKSINPEYFVSPDADKEIYEGDDW